MEHESLKHVFAPVLRVLKDLGGKFVFTDDEGNTFVLMSKKELVEQRSKQEQLPLPEAQVVEAAVRQYAPEIADDVIDAINRDIALSGQESLLPEDDLAASLPPAPKVRFEALRGDLPPQLQD